MIKWFKNRYLLYKRNKTLKNTIKYSESFEEALISLDCEFLEYLLSKDMDIYKVKYNMFTYESSPINLLLTSLYTINTQKATVYEGRGIPPSKNQKVIEDVKAIIKSFLAKGCSLNIADAVYGTPLAIVMYANDTEMFDYLLSLGADINQNNKYNLPLILWSINSNPYQRNKNGTNSIVDFIANIINGNEYYKYDFNKDVVIEGILKPSNLLMYAIDNNAVGVLDLLLKNKEKINLNLELPVSYLKWIKSNLSDLKGYAENVKEGSTIFDYKIKKEIINRTTNVISHKWVGLIDIAYFYRHEYKDLTIFAEKHFLSIEIENHKESMIPLKVKKI